MASSCRDLLNEVAENRSISKNNPNTYHPGFSYPEQMLHSLKRVFCCVTLASTFSGYSISQKPCRASGLSGTCMFVWECLQSEGRHIGMCVDTFMFGSCCAPAGAALPASPVDDVANANGFAPPRKKPPPPYHHDFPSSANSSKPHGQWQTVQLHCNFLR